jgi:hypothetical protein
MVSQKSRLTENGRQHVVEVMGNPGGHFTQGPQFLGLEQSFPQLFFLSHVFDDGREPDNLIAGTAQW